MKVSIVGCGDSAKEWYRVPVDKSIGVNDCFKFGHEVDILVCVNSPLKFEPNAKNGHYNRLSVIASSNPSEFYCHNSNWRKYFPNAKLLTLKSFYGTLSKGRVYSSKTSPIVAITLAYKLGATEMICWGIDMLGHPNFRKGTKDYDFEMGQYQRLFKALDEAGVKCYLGNENSALKQYLQVYDRS